MGPQHTGPARFLTLRYPQCSPHCLLVLIRLIFDQLVVRHKASGKIVPYILATSFRPLAKSVERNSEQTKHSVAIKEPYYPK